MLPCIFVGSIRWPHSLLFPSSLLKLDVPFAVKPAAVANAGDTDGLRIQPRSARIGVWFSRFQQAALLHHELPLSSVVGSRLRCLILRPDPPECRILSCQKWAGVSCIN